MTQYGSHRLMALFRVYEAFPHDPEFVRLSVLPLIKAELTSFVSRLMSFDRSGIYQFQSQTHHMFQDGVARREFTAVHGFAMELPSQENKRNSVLIRWNLFFHPQLTHEIEIPYLFYSRKAVDDMMNAAYGHLKDVTNFLREKELKDKQ